VTRVQIAPLTHWVTTTNFKDSSKIPFEGLSYSKVSNLTWHERVGLVFLQRFPAKQARGYWSEVIGER
jgi:hypothetical protein